jgi:hypothetical protein
MHKFTPQERALFYSKEFPKFESLFITRGSKRWLSGVWILGNNYKGSGLYGSYPPQYVKRVMSLFPDAEKVLHLFSGSLPPGDYTRFDINPESKADVIGDASELSKYFPKKKFDLILADPPYSIEDALHYGKPMVNRNKVLKECAKILVKGGHLVWLDQVLPMFTKKEFHWWGAIGVWRSTQHRVRGVHIFERV